MCAARSSAQPQATGVAAASVGQCGVRPQPSSVGEDGGFPSLSASP